MALSTSEQRVKKPVLRAFFHRAGLRLTHQRLVIWRELEGRYDHPDVDHIYRAVKPRNPKMSLFTVYRAMNVLEAAGMVRRVATWQGHARYDANVDEHAHFLCATCAKIIDVDTKGACHDLRTQARACVTGVVQRVDLMITGECEACMVAYPAVESSTAN